MQTTVQLALAWALPIFLDLIEDYTLVSASPRLDWEIISDLRFNIHLNFIELTVHLEFLPFKFTPFDFLFRLDSTATQRYCLGFDSYVRTLLAQIKFEYRVMECTYGLVGYLTGNDDRDCFWRSYEPEIPLYSIQVTDLGDVNGEYMHYRCMNWYSADWQEWPLSPEYIDQFQQGYSDSGSAADASDPAFDSDW